MAAIKERKAKKARTPLAQVLKAGFEVTRLPWDTLRFHYDREVDVLYVTIGDSPQAATHADEPNDDGVLLRYKGKKLVGITVLDASKR